MAVFVYYLLESGAQAAMGTGAPPANLTEEVLAARQWGLAQFPEMTGTGGFLWNPQTLAFDPAPPAPNPVDPGAFIMLFTPTEDAAIAASADPGVIQFMRAACAATTIDLNSPAIANGLAYLVGLGLLASGRPAQIIAGEMS